MSDQDRQDILDDIDVAADRLRDGVDMEEVAELSSRLAKARGTTASNATTMVALAAIVGILLDDAPSGARNQLAVVFMRLVQRMMND